MAYSGHPVIPNLTGITPALAVSRTSGQVPFVVQVHGADTTATFSDGGAAFAAQVGRAFDPFLDLEFAWDFGDASGTETLTHPAYGTTVNANDDQTGPEAAYVYRTPGTYTVTLTVRGWDGTQYRTAQATEEVTVSAWSGTDRYFDSAGGSDANPGTEAEPKQTFSALKSWVEGGSNRRALLKRGSSWDAATEIWTNGRSGNRIEAYGSGSAPVLSVATGDGPIRGQSAYGDTSIDNVFSGLHLLAQTGATSSLRFSASENGDSGQPYGALTAYSFLDCTFGGPAAIELASATHAAGRHWTFWRCAFYLDGTTAGHTNLFLGVNEGVAIVGGSFAGGTAGSGGITFDHHAYVGTYDHTQYRWLDFIDSVSLNFCLNTNCRNDHIDTPHVVIDGCDITGTQNGVDASNSSGGPTFGRFDQYIVQHSAFHVGQVGTQGYGFYPGCLLRSVVRDCAFWANPEDAIRLNDEATHLTAYRNRFDAADAAAAITRFGTPTAEAGLFLAANTFGVSGYPDPPAADPATRRRFRGRRHV